MSHNAGGTQMDAIFLEVALAIYIAKAQKIYISFDSAIPLLEISPGSIKMCPRIVIPVTKPGFLWEAEHWISPVDSLTSPRGCPFLQWGGRWLFC